MRIITRITIFLVVLLGHRRRRRRRRRDYYHHHRLSHTTTEDPLIGMQNTVVATNLRTTDDPNSTIVLFPKFRQQTQSVCLGKEQSMCTNCVRISTLKHWKLVCWFHPLRTHTHMHTLIQ